MCLMIVPSFADILMLTVHTLAEERDVEHCSEGLGSVWTMKNVLSASSLG